MIINILMIDVNIKIILVPRYDNFIVHFIIRYAVTLNKEYTILLSFVFIQIN